MKVKLKFLIALALPAIAFSQAAPTSLLPTAASATRVAIGWRAGDGGNTFIVQRRVLGDSYGNLQSVTGTTYTDSAIDPFTIYQYRVVATAGMQVSTPSNEVTVGPPPTGFNVVVSAPDAFDGNTNFGRSPRMVLDQNGDPAILYQVVDPNGDNDNSDSQLLFVRWNRITYKWTSPVLIGITGDTGSKGAIQNITLARDLSSNLLGAAYQVLQATGSKLIYASSSDNGATWKNQTVLASSQYALVDPSLAMSGGQAYLGFHQEATGIVYAAGANTADPATWKTNKVPLPSGYTDYYRIVSVAVDSAGNPGVAFIGADANTNSELFWRPGMAASVVAATNNGKQNDDPDLKLAFAGTQPRLAFSGARDNNFFSDYDHSIWSMKSNDTGNSWAPSANVVSDGNTSIGGPLWIDVGSAGQGVIVTELDGGNEDRVKCGQPKISRSNDFLTWTTCAPGLLNQPSLAGGYPVVRFGANDKIWLSFQNQYKNDLAAGVVVWREPLTASAAAPAISTNGVISAASFAARLSPGALGTVFGSNFATTAKAASDVPLPQNLGGITVSVNGQTAPLFYAGVNQINFQVPYSTAIGTASVVVTANGVRSQAATVTIANTAPGIFVYGTARAVVQNQDFSLNDASTPAKVGSSVVIYATGQGALDNPIPTGAVAPNSPLSRPLQGVTATIGGKAATVLFAGMTPGLVGVMQVNLTIPSLTAGSYPVVLMSGGVMSNSPMITVAP